MESVNVNQQASSKKILALTAVAAVATLLFSIMGAPFLRVLSSATGRWVFWGAGAVLVGILFFAGLNVEGIFIGSVWSTLGAYSEIEKKGFSWKNNFFVSLFAGSFFTVVATLAVFRAGLSTSIAEAAVTQITAPIIELLNQAFPDKKFEPSSLFPYFPGGILASLMLSLSAGLAFESQIFKVFNIRRERIVAGLRWLDFKLPDWFIWTSMIGLIFGLIDIGLPAVFEVIGTNILFVSAAAFFIQGLVVFEYAARLYRFGPMFKILMYTLILFWAMPAVIILGLGDYWLDFRTRMTLRATRKTNETKE